MRYAPRALLACGLGFTVSVLVACGGGSGLLSSGDASSLNNQLTQLSAAVKSGNCGGAQTAIAGFLNSVDNLPPSVSPTLTTNLKDGAQALNRLALQQCQNPQTSTSSSSTTSSTSTTSTPSTTDTSTSSSSVPTTTSATSSSVPTSTATSSTVPTSASTTSGSGGAGLGGSGGGGTSGGGSGIGQ